MFGGDNTQAEEIFPGVKFYSANREPCIVCNHPTGDCGSHSSDSQQESFPPLRIQFGEIATKKQEDDPEVRVERDIFKEVQLTSMTKTRVLVARAGTFIPKSKAQELGLII
jgi:hypothetical protein